MDEKPVLRGSGGGGSSKRPRQPTRTPDNLFSTDVVELVLGVSEGPVKGLVDGPKTFFAGDTPLVGIDGTPNASNFQLSVHLGGNPASPINLMLGGGGISTQVGVDLKEQGASVVRRGQLTEIDFIELRFAIHRLMRANNDGDFAEDGVFRVEWKAASSTSWTNPYENAQRVEEEQVSSIQTIYGPSTDTAGRFINPSRRQIYVQDTAPTEIFGLNPIWFDSNDNYRPYVAVNDAWSLPTDLTTGTWTGPAYFYWQWTEYGVTRRAFIGDLGSPPYGMGQFDIWVTPQTGHPAVPRVYNGSSWVPPTDPGQLSSGGDIRIRGKTTGTYVKEIRIPVQRIAEPYDIRITRVSPRNTTEYFFDFVFESFQEVRREPLIFNDLACAHLIVKATDNFNNLPDFTGVWDGRVIRVPSNYDPVTKTYTGLWDGTFKLEWTDNPAWIAYDLVMNDRYGVNAYRPVNLDKYATYEFGVHCDRFGFTFNDLIQEPRSLSEAINYVCGLAGGRLVDREDGYATIIFDAPEQAAVALFSPENVIDGIFNYSFTDINSRKNDITVSFINPDLNWREDRRRVFDSEMIAKHGRIAEEFIAVGCTSEEEAIRRARLRLATATRETCIVSFRTNRMGLYIKPFDVILVADDEVTPVITGRIEQQVSDTQVGLRDPIFLEAGLTYQVKFTLPTEDGFEVQTRTVTNTVGTHYTLNFTPALAGLPEHAVFSIECEEAGAVPKAFRITAIEEEEDDPDNVAITAIEVFRTKWDYVNGTVELPVREGSGRITVITYPPNNVRLIPQTTASGKHNLNLVWDESITQLLAGYRVRVSINGGPFELLATVRATNYVYEHPTPALYRFSITAVNIDGLESAPVTIEHEIVADGTIRAVAPVTNLRLADVVDDPIVFTTVEPRFVWDASTDPYVSHYEIRILDPVTGAVRRIEEHSDTYFVYTLDRHKVDGLSRTVRMSVTAVDGNGAKSQPVEITVTNPPPAAIIPTVEAGFQTAIVTVPEPTEPDYRGIRLWAGDTAGFAVNDASLFYEGPNTIIVVPIEAKKFFRIAAYDAFGKTDLNVSSEFSVTPLTIDTTPPDVPTGLTLTPFTETDDLGSVRVGIRATVDASPSENFEDFLFSISEDGTTFFSYVSPVPRFTFDNLTPNTLYTVRAAARSKNGYISGETQATATTDNPSGAGLIPGSRLINETILAEKIADNAIPVSKLLISDNQNLLLNGDFVYALDDWCRFVGDVTRVTGVDLPAGAPTSAAVRLARTTSEVSLSQGAKSFHDDANFQFGVPCNVGDEFYAEAWVYTTAAGTNNCFDFVQRRASDGGPVGVMGTVVVGNNALPANTWVKIGKTFKATVDGRVYLRPFNSFDNSILYVTRIRFMRRNAGELIVDGAVTANKVAASAITADKLAANSVTAVKIAAGAITAEKIAARAITADLIAIGGIDGTVIADGAVTTGKVAALAITSEKVAANAITADKLAAGSVVADKIAAGAITSGKIAAGAVTARELAANAATITKLTITDFDNAITNPLLDRGTNGLDGWSQGGGASRVAAGDAGVPGGARAPYLFRLPTPPVGSESYAQFSAVRTPIAEGETAHAAITASRASGTVGPLTIQLAWFDRDGNSIDWTGLVIYQPEGGTNGTWHRYTVNQPAPANAASVMLKIASYDTSGTPDAVWYVSNPLMRRSVRGELIVDGSITAEKIKAGTITADRIVANEITADRIAGGFSHLAATAGTVNLGTGSSSWTNLGPPMTLTVTNLGGYSFPLVLIKSNATVQDAGGGSTNTARCRLLLNGSVVYEWSLFESLPIQPYRSHSEQFNDFTTLMSSGDTHTFQLQYSHSYSGSSGTIFAKVGALAISR